MSWSFLSHCEPAFEHNINSHQSGPRPAHLRLICKHKFSAIIHSSPHSSLHTHFMPSLHHCHFLLFWYAWGERKWSFFMCSLTCTVLRDYSIFCWADITEQLPTPEQNGTSRTHLGPDVLCASVQSKRVFTCRCNGSVLSPSVSGCRW